MPLELWVNRQDLRSTRVVQHWEQPLQVRQIRVRLDFHALTANNVSYAVTGDEIGYWAFYPAEAGWGMVPAWGFAEVIESACDELAPGERLYGFFPMATHAVLTVGDCTDTAFTEVSQHRHALPAVYNFYRRTSRDPAFQTASDEARCLFIPLLMTAYFLYDYLMLNRYFGAGQVVIGSVSSKTGLGLAKFLSEVTEARPRLVGVTSAANAAFVRNMGLCDQVVVYGDEHLIDASLPCAYIDMSGNARLADMLHRLLRDNLLSSCRVGFTHWEALGEDAATLPGARPIFFFAPDHIATRDREWGAGVLAEKAAQASARVAGLLEEQLQIERVKGAAAVARAWKSLLDNDIAPGRGIIASLE